MRRSQRWSAVGLVALVVLMAGGPMVGTAAAAWTASVLGDQATMTGFNDLGGLRLRVSDDGLVWQHNQRSQGDTNFASDRDFNTVDAGEQTLANVPGALLQATVSGGVAESVIVGGTSSPADLIQGSLTVTPNGSDSLTVFGDDNGHTLGLGPTPTITGLAGGTITYGPGLNSMILTMGSGNDHFSVTGATTVQTELYGQAGNDTLSLGPAGSLGSFGRFSGGEGTDTLDYSNFNAAATANVAREATFVASLDESQEVPPTGSIATGNGFVLFPDLPVNNNFNYNLQVFGLDSGDITDSHIHAAPAGVNGNVVFGIGPGGGWDNPGPDPNVFGDGETAPAITEPALRDGGTYFNVHSAAFPGGEIRGQLLLDSNTGYGGPISGGGRAFMVENVFGGSAGDTLDGSPRANMIDGAGGADTVRGADGGDVVTGGAAADGMFGGNGPDILRAEDGGADTTVDCGPGMDYAMVDGGDPTAGCEGVDQLPPPTGLATTPGSPSNDTTPHVTGAAFPGSTVKVYGNAGCSGAELGTATATAAGAFDIEVSVADGSNSSLAARAEGVDPASACSAAVAYQELADSPGPGPGPGPGPDTDPPSAVVNNGPKKKTKSTNATFRFSSDEDGATFECAIDKKTAAPCTSPKKYKRLKRRKHKFTLTAIDAAGNKSASTTFSWRILK